MATQRIIVIGGVAAGPTAAVQARRTDPQAEVVLLEKGQDISYGACEMPYLLGGQIPDAGSLVAHSPEEFQNGRGVTTRILHRVESIDPAQRRVQGTDIATGVGFSMRFDKLVLATGARVAWPEGDGFTGPRVHGFRTLDDARRLHAVAGVGPQRFVVVGAGYVGLEVADQLVLAGHRVTLLAPEGPLGGTLPPSMQAVLEAACAQRGIGIRKSRGVSVRHDAPAAPLAVRTDTGELIGADRVIVATGVRPDVQLAGAAGLRIGQEGGVLTDHGMRTSATTIWACGDCVETPHLVTGRHAHIPLSPLAFRTARVAGHNAARRGRQDPRRFEGSVGAYALVVAGLEVGVAGIGLLRARALGLDALGVVITHASRASHMAGRRPLHVHLVVERRTRRLLGGQILGGDGAALRTNVLVPLLREGASVDDLYDLDLVYTPAVSPSLDPLLVAARQAQKQLEG